MSWRVYLWYLSTNNWVSLGFFILSLVALFSMQTYTAKQVSGLSTTRPAVRSSTNFTSILSVTTSDWSTQALSSSDTTVANNVGVNRAYANLYRFFGLIGILTITIAISSLCTSLIFAFSSFNIHRLMLSMVITYLIISIA